MSYESSLSDAEEDDDPLWKNDRTLLGLLTLHLQNHRYFKCSVASKQTMGWGGISGPFTFMSIFTVKKNSARKKPL